MHTIASACRCKVTVVWSTVYVAMFLLCLCFFVDCSWGTSWGCNGTFRLAYGAAFGMPADYTYAVQFGPMTEAAKQVNARQLLGQGTQSALAPINGAQCLLYKAKRRMRLMKLHDLLATLARASADFNPAHVMLDLVAYNSGFLRNLAAPNNSFRVCGKARELLTAALDANATINDPQAAALLRIKAQMDTSGVLTSWKIEPGATGATYCSWTGVSCSSNKQVTAVGLWSFHTTSLQGKLPPATAFQGLSSLTAIYLAEQPGITGTLPADWSLLRQLQVIWLADLGTRGGIPSSWGSLENLVTLYLTNSQLTGSIPESFGALTSMQDLKLSQNKLVGSIPTTLGNLRKLTVLFLWGNQLTGQIPATFAALTSMKNLQLAQNLLVGSIPTWLEMMKNLSELGLQNNELTGTLPDMLSSLPQLAVLNVGQNRLVGTLPDSYQSLTKLAYLELSTNNFTGTVPSSWSAMLALRELWLNNNPSLGGCLPPPWQTSLGASWDVDKNILSGTRITGFCGA